MISILWVDDDEGLTKARAEHLRNKSQWEVVTAFSAQSALALIRTSRPRFSAIVLDVIMPPPRGWGDERCVGEGVIVRHERLLSEMREGVAKRRAGYLQDSFERPAQLHYENDRRRNR